MSPALRIPRLTKLSTLRVTLPWTYAGSKKRALDGKAYRALGFDCLYYDHDLVDAFYAYLASHSDIYFDPEAAKKILEEDHVHRFRYLPTYRSGNDYSRLFVGAVELRLESDSLLIFDNRRYMHSATQSVGERDMWAAFLPE